MAFALSALDVHYLVREISPVLQDAFLDKVYQGGEEKGDFLLRLRSPKTGKQQLYFQVPLAAFLTEHRFSWPQNPRGFCMQLRKHLTNAKLVAVEQKRFERVLELSFEKGESSWRLVVELFSKGNVILVNGEGVIRGVLDLQRWKGRTLRVNDAYEYPPFQEDTPGLSLGRLQELLSDNDREVVKFCATVLGLGGKYAEEAVSRAGVDKNAKSLSDDEACSLHDAVRSLFNEDFKAMVLGGDASPFALQGWVGAQEHDSFSAAIESLVVTGKIEDIESSFESVASHQKNRHERIVEEQTRKLEGYRTAADENQAKGEAIYGHYQELHSLLEAFKELHAKGGWQAVKAFIKEKGLPVAVDEKNGKFVVDL